MNNSSDYFILYPCAGRTRSYTFSIDACTPVRTMTKREVAALYFPDEPKGELARKALFYELLHARQPAGRLSDDDQALARPDGFVYLADVLHDISPCDTAKLFLSAHVAAILHFLGPASDEEDYAARAA
jgi:hypothetical protein